MTNESSCKRTVASHCKGSEQYYKATRAPTASAARRWIEGKHELFWCNLVVVVL